MEEERLPCAEEQQGREGTARETFERVWRRVMPEDRPDCPFTLYTDEMRRKEEEPPAAAPEPPAPCAVQPPAGAASTLPLQQFVFREAEERERCRGLSRMLWGSHARAVSCMAEDHRRGERRLRGTYFLLTGVRLSPRPRRRMMGRNALAALREGYEAAGESAKLYRAAAEETEDAALAALYRELSEQGERHTGLLRRILEQM